LKSTSDIGFPLTFCLRHRHVSSIATLLNVFKFITDILYGRLKERDADERTRKR